MFPARPNKTRPFLIHASGFTLGQLLASLLIITTLFFFVGAVLYPVFATTRDRNRPNFCASNIKQINLGMLQYLEDYDDRFPPCAVSLKNDEVLFGWAATHGLQGEAALSKSWIKRGATTTAQATYDQLIGSYVKNGALFRCPEAPRDFGPVSYMYNDLAAGIAQKDCAAPDKTVLVCDGENFAGNVGHAYEPNNLASAPQFSAKGAVEFGATLQTAPLRHNGGASYGFVDGHVKWSKPESIYFPFRQNDNRSHIDKHNGEATGPDPAKLNAAGFIGTFQVK